MQKQANVQKQPQNSSLKTASKSQTLLFGPPCGGCGSGGRVGHLSVIKLEVQSPAPPVCMLKYP